MSAAYISFAGPRRFSTTPIDPPSFWPDNILLRRIETEYGDVIEAVALRRDWRKYLGRPVVSASWMASAVPEGKLDLILIHLSRELEEGGLAPRPDWDEYLEAPHGRST